MRPESGRDGPQRARTVTARRVVRPPPLTFSVSFTALARLIALRSRRSKRTTAVTVLPAAALTAAFASVLPRAVAVSVPLQASAHRKGRPALERLRARCGLAV